MNLAKPLYSTSIPSKRRKKSGRKLFKLLLFFIVVAQLMFLILPQFVVYADKLNSIEEVTKELENNVDDKLNDLDLSELESFVNGLKTDGFSGSVAEFMKKLIKGDYEGGYSEYFTYALKELGLQVVDFLPMLATIIGIAVLFSILNGLSSGFINKSTTEIIYFVCYAAIVVVVITKVTSIIALTTTTVGNMSKLMNIAFPILLTLITALGGVVCVAAYQPMMAVVSTLVVGAINAVIIPCFVATMILAVVGNITDNIKLAKLTKFFKSAGQVVIGFMFSLFITFVTLQGITGSIADNISVRSAKFAISSYVPILGGYLSEGFDLIMASVVLIKNALGMSGVLIMLSIVLAPVIKILVFTLGLKLAAGIIEPIGDKRMSDIIYSISENMILLIVAVLGVSFMFFIMIMLSIYTCNMGAA